MLSEFSHEGNSNPAIVDAANDRTVSYSELRELVSRTADWLLEQDHQGKSWAARWGRSLR